MPADSFKTKRLQVPGFAAWAIQSGKGKDWHLVAVCMDTGSTWCSCESFFFRKQKLSPSVDAPESWCKHIKEAMRLCGVS